MNRYEDEFQSNLEGKDPDGDALDLKAYQTVLSGLKKESDFTLSPAFADQVVSLVVKKQKAKNSPKEYFWFGLGISLLFMSFITAIALTDFEFNFGFLNAVSAYRGLIAFAIFFIGLLHWLDKRLIKTTKAEQS
jgi:hypothetical protein